MITEILVRCYTPSLRGYQEKLAGMIRENTNMTPVLIDHSNISLSDFNIGDSVPVSLDRFLAKKFDVPYMQVSRIFDTQGNVKGRKIVVPEIEKENICVIDTDMVYGETILAACNALHTIKFSVPIRVNEHQDLIDVEDLVLPISILDTGGSCDYLLNETFFARRTSLPPSIFRLLKWESESHF